MVPSFELSATFCAELYAPLATLALTALGAVASLDTRPETVLPAPMLYVLATLIGPSANPASEDAGIVELHAPAPLATPEAVWPAESISVTPLALAPGWETPVMVRSPALAELIIERLALLASLGA